ncbi:phosphoribosylglycinamide formyltransferase [Peptoniphilus mikwangii]|uniref:phosphoribosylglycinamide formyltransferase n=1 Tax=Peptoniphilus mikwangii TaxID=1354300 RepID=UPI00040E5445|nr:phosphoribosylglycinamide formyltransferase [Peptoniphilus mikwangii]
MRIAVFISGTGSNLKALIDAKKLNEFDSTIELVLSNKDAKGLFHAYNEKIPTVVTSDEDNILNKLEEYKIDFIVLAGFLPIISKNILEKYKNRIINIHPSLLPKYGGKGYHGVNVHKAVFENKERISGASVHFVTDEIDGGGVIIQNQIDISDCRSPEEIAERVLKIEHSILKKAIKKIEEEQ